MANEEPRLNISFAYDHASGGFTAHLDNGASFHVSREHIGGKLENSLTLFKSGVINSASGKWAKPPRASRDVPYTYDEGKVRRYTEQGLPELNLEDLDLDLG